MAPLQELLTSDDLEKVWEESTQHPAFIFKLSTTCPVSADAFDQYHTFIEGKENEIAAFFVKVRETRDVSNQIEEETGIQHQSPQILFVKDREVLWNQSHAEITIENLEDRSEERRVGKE